MRLLPLTCCFAFGMALVVPRASASENVAEQLFQEGRAALAQGRTAEACPLLADSLSIDPAGGTALLLADCWERLGKLATAWSAYQTALAYAVRDERADRAEAARARIAALTPKLPRLRLVDHRNLPEGASLTLDGEALPSRAWRGAIPVDPGEHWIVLSASGHRAARIRFDAQTGRVTEVVLPRLARSTPQRRLDPRARPSSVVGDVGTTALAVGLASLVAGAIAGVHALHLDARADERCPGAECSDPVAVGDSRAGLRAAQVSNAALGVGAVFSIGGLVLWLVD
jgi:serine/threonine-protein kinase